MASKVAAKKYMGENIEHAQVFTPEDREKVFNLVYEDTPSGWAYAKRFTVGGVTRDKPYELGKSSKTQLLCVSTGDAHHIHIRLRKRPRIKLDLYQSFDELLVKGRAARGNLLTKHRALRVNPISERVYTDRMGIPEDDSQSKLF